MTYRPPLTEEEIKLLLECIVDKQQSLADTESEKNEQLDALFTKLNHTI